MKGISAEIVKPGREANKAQAADWFGISLPAMDGWIRRGCPAIQRGGPGKAWRFDLRSLAEWRYSRNDEGEIGEVDPSAMTPKDRLDHWRAIKVQMDAETQAATLIPAEEVEREMAEMVKQFVLTLDTLPDVLEKDAGILPDAVARSIQVVDSVREDLYQRLVGG